MKKILTALILIFIICYYFNNLIHDNSVTQNSSYILQDFSFSNINDNKIDQISKHQNNLIFINFWASWCKYCIMELPLFVKLAQNNPNITIVLISTDRNKNNVQKISRKFSEMKDNLIWGHDPNREISHGLFNSIAIPETFVFDKEMKFLGKITGLVSEKQLQKFTKNH